ncbi:MAG TPA: carboxypeptidase-like regulatory domain-containing protein [Pyrinomonadaceae bacterium]
MSSINRGFFILGLLLIFSISTVFAQTFRKNLLNVGAFRSQATLTTGKTAYNRGETVAISGAGFGSFEDVSLSVETYNNSLGQNVALMRWNVYSDKSGNFTASIPFDSLSSESGRYTINAIGSGTQTSAGTIIENVILAASADLDQCANGGVGDPPDPCTGAAWVNGNVNQSKGHWTEGQSVAYRQKLTGFTVGLSNSVTIGYDTTKGGKHALDYLTSFDRTETLAMGNNPCSGVAGCSLGTFTTAPIPTDANVTAGFDQFPGNGDDIAQIPGVFTLFGGTITGVSAYTVTGSYAGDSHTSITITFTANSANMVLAWGGHIGTRADWGTGNSAINISGSPYHMNQDSCSFGCGAMDRALSATAVALNSRIIIFKQAAPQSSWVFNFTTTGTGLSPFSLIDDGVDNDATPNNITFNNLLAPNASGTFTVAENFATNGQFDLTSIVCSVSAGGTSTTTANVPLGSVSINLAYGNTVTCTFNNAVVTAANVTAAGRVSDAYGNGIARASVTIQNTTNGETRTVLTNGFGYYRFDGIPAGNLYIISVSHRRYSFDNSSQILQLEDAIENIDFTALPE